MAWCFVFTEGVKCHWSVSEVKCSANCNGACTTVGNYQFPKACKLPGINGWKFNQWVGLFGKGVVLERLLLSFLVLWSSRQDVWQTAQSTPKRSGTPVVCNTSWSHLKPKTCSGYLVIQLNILQSLLPVYCRTYKDYHALHCIAGQSSARIKCLSVKNKHQAIIACSFSSWNIPSRSIHGKHFVKHRTVEAS